MWNTNIDINNMEDVETVTLDFMHWTPRKEKIEHSFPVMVMEI